MASDAPKSRTQTGNTGTFTVEAPAELPKEVEKAIYLAVRRGINALRREIEAKRPRMVTEKHTHFNPKEFVETLLALRRECDRAEALLASLHTEREKLLRIMKPELFT